MGSRITKRVHLQVFGSLVRLSDPLIQLSLITHPETDFERPRVESQRGLVISAVDGIEYGIIRPVLCRNNRKSGDCTEKCSEELTVGEMRARTHTTTCTIGIMWRARPVSNVEVALWSEFEGLLEVVGVVVGSVRILVVWLAIRSTEHRVTC